MASPQPDKFTKISNELLDALAKIRIAGEARQMLDVIIRKTYGFNKKEDKISTSQFIELTGLSRIAIPKARRKLLELNLITVSQKGYSQGLTYSIQKDYNKWKPYPKKDTVSQKGYRCIQKRTQVYPKKDTNCIPKSSTQKKERQYTKETIQKKERFNEIYKSYPNRDSKKKAEEHFNASVKAEKDWQDINTALVKYKKHLAIETWLKPKSASTWFYNWRDWVDYIEPQKTSQKFIPISEQIKIEREQERKQKEVIC